MDIVSTVERFGGEPLKEKNSKLQLSAIDHITHDIVNQLSVICLCCCELRNSLSAKLDSDQLNEFKRIECTVQDAPNKIQQLKPILRAHLPAWDDDNLSEPALNRANREDNFQIVLARSISQR